MVKQARIGLTRNP